MRRGNPCCKSCLPDHTNRPPLRAAFAKLALTERLKLVKTLEVYFNNCRNSANTARDLFIHRNTLLYRLEQISKILDLDLNNNEQVLIIQLALKALIMVK